MVSDVQRRRISCATTIHLPTLARVRSLFLLRDKHDPLEPLPVTPSASRTGPCGDTRFSDDSCTVSVCAHSREGGVPHPLRYAPRLLPSFTTFYGGYRPPPSPNKFSGVAKACHDFTNALRCPRTPLTLEIDYAWTSNRHDRADSEHGSDVLL